MDISTVNYRVEIHKEKLPMINLIEYIRKEFKNQDLLDVIKIGWTSQQPDLVKGVPAHVRGIKLGYI